MKKVFITVNDGAIARNILRSFVLEKLLEHPDVVIGLITHEAKKEAHEKEFGSPRVKIHTRPSQQVTFFHRILSFLIRNGLRTETILMDQRTHVDGRWAAYVIKRVFIYILGKSRIFHYFVRRLFLLRKASTPMKELFLQEKPDLLFSTDVHAELDVDAMAAARKAGVKILGMVRSWDNPTARSGLMPFIPDELLVWSPYVRRITAKVQHVPEEKMIMVGIPHYDWYAKKEIIRPRKEFLEKLGIDRDTKVILFAGEGAFHAPHEIEALEIISEALRDGRIRDSQNLTLIFRPHPAFKVDEKRARGLDNVIFDREISGYTGRDPSSWEMGKAQLTHLVNSLYHADLVITTASTMTMDAAVFDKPVICIAFDGKSKEPYWNSVRRYYRDYTHYKEISKTGGFRIAYDSDELIRYVNEYFLHPERDAEGRKKIRNHFIWRVDGGSSERVVNEIRRFLR